MAQDSSRSARERLIVALDIADLGAALNLAGRLRGHVGMLKVGLELFTAAGPAAARDLAQRGDHFFLDLKFHDIPNTVRGAARAAARTGAAMLDVHAAGGRAMMEAALEGVEEARAGAERLRVLGITILTSLAAGDLDEIGLNGTAESAALRLAKLARTAGLDGVVASPHEAARIRVECGPDFLIVTPGIRPASFARNDQSRVATPEDAIRAGADFIVVGRPITQASDPATAADAVAEEIRRALATSSRARV